jgi:hypothetical protein
MLCSHIQHRTCQIRQQFLFQNQNKLIKLHILKKYESFPNHFILLNLYSCLNKDRKDIDINRAFKIAVYNIELFNVSAANYEDFFSDIIESCLRCRCVPQHARCTPLPRAHLKSINLK